MQVMVKVEHFLPTGFASVSVVRDGLPSRTLPLYVNRPEKECERAIRKVIRQLEKWEIGRHMTCWTMHKLDQFVAEQRQWDARSEDDEDNC